MRFYLLFLRTFPGFEDGQVQLHDDHIDLVFMDWDGVEARMRNVEAEVGI